MNWERLELAAQYTEAAERVERNRIGNQQYRDYVDGRDDQSWWSKSPVDHDEARLLLNWLNDWDSRVKKGDETEDRLSRAGCEAAAAMAVLREQTLLTVNLDVETRGSIAQAFDAFRMAMSRSTAAAKAMHMMNRRLFVMGDAKIRGGYAVDQSGDDYANLFLPLMQEELTEAVQSFTSAGLVAEGGAAEALDRRCCPKWPRPLAKIVDEFNYWKFTVRMEDLWHPLVVRRIVTAGEREAQA